MTWHTYTLTAAGWLRSHPLFGVVAEAIPASAVLAGNPRSDVLLGASAKARMALERAQESATRASEAEALEKQAEAERLRLSIESGAL